MTNTKQWISLFAITAILLTGTISMSPDAFAKKDDNPGKAKGCEKANENSKVREKNPHCESADLEITAPEEIVLKRGYSGYKYIVTITNNGPDTAENIVVNAASDSSGIAVTDVTVLGSIDVDAGNSVDAVIKVELDRTKKIIDGNVTVIVSSDTNDPDESNNSATTHITTSGIKPKPKP